MDCLLDALIDTLKLIPFLFLTYLAMEYLEHMTGDKAARLVKKAGKSGPLLGGLLGIIPQCGFSAAASNLYAGRVISVGTLMAIYLSTSDEMLPILISERVPISFVLRILLAKAVIGILFGFLIDLVFTKKHPVEHENIHEMCEKEHCDCEKGILKSAFSHTLQITFFIFVISLVLNFGIEFIGEDVFAGFIIGKPVLGPILAGIVGLIPNCAGSVIITQLYLDNIIGIGSMLAGLLTGSGVGVLVLFRVNHPMKRNLSILGTLYLIGVVVGIAAELIL